MAGGRSPRRMARPLALALPIALLVSTLSLLPAVRGTGPPRTEARRIRIALDSLLGGGVTAGLRLTRAGDLLATRPAPTAWTTACSPIWSTGVGLTWIQNGRGDVEVSVRSGEGGGTFGSATVVEAIGDHAPDPGTAEDTPARRTTSFLWTGGGRCLRFLMHLPAGASIRNLEAVFVNTSGTTNGPGTAPGEPLASRVLGLLGGMLGADRAEAMTTRPAMVPRWGWGADDDLNNCDPYYAPALKMAFVHHTAGTNDYSRGDVDDILRGIQYFHTQIQGWCDIAYNFLVDRFGRVYIGRKGGADRPTVPGATQGFNMGSTAVAAMGNYEEVPVPAVVLSAIERLLAWRLDVAHLPATGWATMTSAGGDHTRYPEGTTVTLSLISGHRRTGYTSCPGDYLAAHLPRIRTEVAGMGLPKIYRPRQTTLTIVPGVDEVTFSAIASEALSWRLDVLDPAGATVRTFAPDGPALSVTWGGKLPDGSAAPPGTYTVVVSGFAGGGSALPATMILSLVPEPTPSPSPSPTESPSPSPTA